MQSDKKLRPVFWLDLTEGRRTLPREDALAKQLEVCIVTKNIQNSRSAVIFVICYTEYINQLFALFCDYTSPILELLIFGEHIRPAVDTGTSHLTVVT